MQSKFIALPLQYTVFELHDLHEYTVLYVVLCTLVGNMHRVLFLKKCFQVDL